MKKRRATSDAHIVLFLVFTGILMSYIVKHYLSDYFIARPRLFTAIIFSVATFGSILFIDNKNYSSVYRPLKAFKIYVTKRKGVLHKSGMIILPAILYLVELYILAYNWSHLKLFEHYFYSIWLFIYLCAVIIATITLNTIDVYEDEYENLIKCN